MKKLTDLEKEEFLIKRISEYNQKAESNNNESYYIEKLKDYKLGLEFHEKYVEFKRNEQERKRVK